MGANVAPCPRHAAYPLPMNRDALAAWLTESFPHWEDQKLGDVTELDGGWESDIFRFSLIHSGRSEDLVLRRYSGDNGGAKARHEFRGMAKLHALGYPVPRVLAAEPNETVLGRPFMVMDWVPGHADRPWPDVVEGPDLPAFVKLQADLHRLPWQPFADHPDPSAAQTIAMWRRLSELFADLEFGAGMGWLASHVGDIAQLEPVVIHWDFHVGNVLVDEVGTTHVLDWTQIAVTDRRFDVAWTELLIAMAVSPSAATGFRAEYERQTQPLADMAFFETAVALKRLFSVAVSLHASPESLGMRPEAAERMRRDAHTLALPYATVRHHTGMTIPLVEALIST